jgi:hypothetical protein
MELRAVTRLADFLMAATAIGRRANSLERENKTENRTQARY